jgi:transcriptional regulator with XRE-family HTH domain
MQKVLEALAARIRELRTKSGFSQEAFADHCGLHRTAMSLLEQAQRAPTLRTLLILSWGLKIPLAKLVKGVDTGMKSPPRSRTRGKPKSKKP